MLFSCWASSDGRAIKESGRSFVYNQLKLISLLKFEFFFSRLNGRQQSPINLKPASSVQSRYLPFRLDFYDVAIPKIKLENNGHTLELSLPADYPDEPRMSGVGLKDVYKFVDLHFHWARDPKKGGSEHLIDSLFSRDAHDPFQHEIRIKG